MSLMLGVVRLAIQATSKDPIRTERHLFVIPTVKGAYAAS
jgi:hypothetical protein